VQPGLGDQKHLIPGGELLLPLRSIVGGQRHKVSARHLHVYAAHAAWMTTSAGYNSTLANRALGLALASGIFPAVEGPRSQPVGQWPTFRLT
jgi:hypothetical protein